MDDTESESESQSSIDLMGESDTNESDETESDETESDTSESDETESETESEIDLMDEDRPDTLVELVESMMNPADALDLIETNRFIWQQVSRRFKTLATAVERRDLVAFGEEWTKIVTRQFLDTYGKHADKVIRHSIDSSDKVAQKEWLESIRMYMFPNV